MLEHTGGIRGWAGDSPLIHLDTTKIRALGWEPTVSIREAVIKTLEWFEATRVVEERSERHLQPRAAAHLARRRRDRPAVLLPEHTGFLISGAIDKYVYMLTHTVFQRRYRLKYAEFEEVDDPREIRHPILREALVRHWRGEPLEIASVADVPAGTGMGSSGAFTVCLLKALALARRTTLPPRELAEAACEIEIDILREPIGKQDQYVAAHGGICAYTFHPDGSVNVEPLELSGETLDRMSSNLLLFYTGEARSASAILADQNRRTREQDDEMLENLHRTKQMGVESRALLEAGDLERYAELMHEHWQNKRSVRRGWPTSTSTGSTRWRAGAASSAASSSARAAAASCSSTRRGPTTRGRRWAPRAAGAALRLRLPGRDRRGADIEGGHRRLRADRSQAGGGAGHDDELVADLRRRAQTLRAGACESRRRAAGPRARRRRRRHHARPARRERDRRARGGRARAGREARGDRRGGRRGRRARPPSGRGGGSRSASTTASIPGDRARVEEARSGAHGDIMNCAPATVTAAGSATTASGAPTRARPAAANWSTRGCTCSTSRTGCSARCRCTPRCCAPSTGTCRSRTTRRAARRARPRRSVGALHVTWTEWKNLFSLEITCRTGKLQVDGLVRSYGAQRLTLYPMKPEMGPPDVDVIDYPPEDVSWAEEWRHFKAAIEAPMAFWATSPRRATLGPASRPPTCSR